MARFFIKCKQAHQMVSEGMDHDLSPGDRARLNFHLHICRACSRFNKQMGFLRNAMHELGGNSEPPGDSEK